MRRRLAALDGVRRSERQRLVALLTAASSTNAIRVSGAEYLDIAADLASGQVSILEALDRVPLMDKRHARFHSGRLAQQLEDLDVRRTTGSTGERTQVLRSKLVAKDRVRIERRLFDALGLPEKYTVAILRANMRPAERVRGILYDPGARVIQLGAEHYPKFLQAASVPPDVVLGTPSIIERARRRCGDHGLKYVSFAELSRPQRTLGEEAPGPAEAPAELYAAAEIVAPIAYRYPGCERLHVNSDVVVVEVLCPASHRRLQCGEIGELVVTDLLNTTMPFIRYRIADVGSLRESGDCACGRGGYTIELWGRLGARSSRAQAIVRTLPQRYTWLAVESEPTAMTVFGVDSQTCVGSIDLASRLGVRLSLQKDLPRRFEGLAHGLPGMAISTVPKFALRGEATQENRTAYGCDRCGRRAPLQVRQEPEIPISRGLAQRVVHSELVRTRRRTAVSIVGTRSMEPLLNGPGIAVVTWLPDDATIRRGALIVARFLGVTIVHRAIKQEMTGLRRTLQMADNFRGSGAREQYLTAGGVSVSWIPPRDVLGVVHEIREPSGVIIYDDSRRRFRIHDWAAARLGVWVWHHYSRGEARRFAVAGAVRHWVLKMLTRATKRDRPLEQNRDEEVSKGHD